MRDSSPNPFMKYPSLLTSLLLLTLAGCEFDTRDPLKIEKATSMTIEDGGNLELFLVRFTYQGKAGVLLWKSEPGIEVIAGRESSLQSLSGHKLRYETLSKTNYVNSDFTVVSIPDDQIPYSTSSHDYNRPEITRMLPVVCQ